MSSSSVLVVGVLLLGATATTAKSCTKAQWFSAARKFNMAKLDACIDCTFNQTKPTSILYSCPLFFLVSIQLSLCVDVFLYIMLHRP